MATKVKAPTRNHKKKVSNIISSKNARIIPAGESIQSLFDKTVVANHKASLARSHKKKVLMTLPATEFGETFPKLAGKPATILYKKLPDDMILITGFENFLSGVELEKKHGEIVSDIYSKYPNKMAKVFDTFGNLHIYFGCNDTVCIGAVFPKKEFLVIVQRVKKCGGLLHDIILACDKGEVKRIEI